MSEARTSWSWRSAGRPARGFGVLVAALALLSTSFASGVAAADSNRASALEGLLAEMPGTVDTASSGTLNLKRLLTYTRNAEQRKFTRKVLTENGFDGAYIRFSSTDDVGYTQYRVQPSGRRARRGTPRSVSHVSTRSCLTTSRSSSGRCRARTGTPTSRRSRSTAGTRATHRRSSSPPGRDYFEVGGCSDKSRSDTGDLRAFANAQYCLAAGASGGEHCLVDFDAETNGLASSALDIKQAASFVGNERFLKTHGYVGGTYAAGTLTEGGVEILSRWRSRRRKQPVRSSSSWGRARAATPRCNSSSSAVFRPASSTTAVPARRRRHRARRARHPAATRRRRSSVDPSSTT